ncbi:MAG: glycosyltransferase family 2 protein [Clostridia bacterium]|nr:glycosyltransferase family 2 protein [Clostridia bacterium]
MASVTAIILTKNEELNLGRCLDSIRGFVQRAIVVDSGSTDNTIAIAKEKGADVYVHPFENYARQFNWGIDECNITTTWTLRLDADECFPAELCSKLEKILSENENTDLNGIMLESNFYFLGKLIRHGGPKKRKIMLFRTGKGRIEDRRMDEHTTVDGGRILELKDRFDHYDFKDIDSWIQKMNWYATREMQDYFEAAGQQDGLASKKIAAVRKKKFGFYYKLPLFLRCWMLFIYNYIFRLGFLDGKEGFVYHWMYQRWYRTLVDAKILEQKLNPKPFAVTGALGSTDIERARKEAGER